jgi:hypothetical protein
MKVKLNVEIHADIPGEFQDDSDAVQLLQQEINERFEIDYEYDKEDQPSVMFTSAKIKMYVPGAGKL